MPSLGPGEWEETRDDCACYCPVDLPTVVPWIAIPDGVGGWLDYSSFEGGGPGGYGFPFVDTFTTGGEDAARVQFRYTPDATARYTLTVRLLNITQHVSPTPWTSAFVSSIFLTDPDGTGVMQVSPTLDYIVLSSVGTDGVQLWLVGPPLAPGVLCTGTRQEQEAVKRGFRSYNQTVGSAPRIFLTEAASGSYDGDEPGGGPARTYSGGHHFSVATVGDFDDPSGAYASTLSADLIHQRLSHSPPTSPGKLRIQRIFGTPSETEVTRFMQRTYTKTDGAEGNEHISLALDDEYVTADMEAAVQESLDDQLAAASDVTLPVGGVVTRHFLSKGECLLRRIQSYLHLTTAAPAVYLPSGDSFNVTIRWKRRVYDKRGGGMTETTQTASIGATVASTIPLDGAGRGVTLGAMHDVSEDSPADNTDVEYAEFTVDTESFYLGPFLLERVP